MFYEVSLSHWCCVWDVFISVDSHIYWLYISLAAHVNVCFLSECFAKQGTVVNRPLAGTRRRGKTPEEDMAMERDLLADEKECAEHVMLVDLGRNDVGKVEPNTHVLVVSMSLELQSFKLK